QPLDRALAGLVARMRLAGQHDLERLLLGNPAEPLEIGEEQLRTLVLGHPAGVTDQRALRVEHDAAAGPDPLEQLPLRVYVSLPQRLRRNGAIGAHQVLGLDTPARDMTIVERRDLRMRPRAGMNAVRDRVDGVAWKELAGRLRVPLRGAVHVLAEAR